MIIDNTSNRSARTPDLSVVIFATMTDYLYQRFPQHSAAIKALEAKDANFYEACSNYEEICTWLATQEHRSISTPEELDQARELKRDLEDEILTLLEDHNDIIR